MLGYVRSGAGVGRGPLRLLKLDFVFGFTVYVYWINRLWCVKTGIFHFNIRRDAFDFIFERCGHHIDTRWLTHLLIEHAQTRFLYFHVRVVGQVVHGRLKHSPRLESLLVCIRWKTDSVNLVQLNTVIFLFFFLRTNLLANIVLVLVRYSFVYHWLVLRNFHRFFNVFLKDDFWLLTLARVRTPSTKLRSFILICITDECWRQGHCFIVIIFTATVSFCRGDRIKTRWRHSKLDFLRLTDSAWNGWFLEKVSSIPRNRLRFHVVFSWIVGAARRTS